MTDQHYAWRQIRNSPGFACVVVGLIGVGIAANASIFTLVDALLLPAWRAARVDPAIALRQE